MTINDIMLRDIADAERQQSERAEREAATIGDSCALPWLAVALWLAIVLAALGAAFAGGMYYQSRRALKADRDFAAWNERVEREATEAARAMSNQELLNATRRECADPANR
jgi:predicted lysophospholipase L1 biosynthesis ABC-type transport system permease subunit